MLQNPSASIRSRHNCPTRWELSYPSRVAEVEQDAGESSYIQGGSPDLSRSFPGPLQFLLRRNLRGFARQITWQVLSFLFRNKFIEHCRASEALHEMSVTIQRLETQCLQKRADGQYEITRKEAMDFTDRLAKNADRRKSLRSSGWRHRFLLE